MNACRKEKDEYIQRGLFWKFSAYLSLVTWKKTHRRLMNWTSQGFIHAIAYVPLDVLQSKAASPRNPNLKKSNKSLHKEILTLHEEERGIERLMDLLTSIQFQGSHLKPNDLKGLLDELANEEANPTSSAYNEASSIPFHCFFIALLIGFVKALSEMDEVEKAEGKARQEQNTVTKKDKGKGKPGGGAAKSKDGNARRSEILAHIWDYGRILWTVVSSRMFDDHLQSLQGLLAAVVPGQMSLYKAFFRRLEARWFDRPVGVHSRDGQEREGEGEGEGAKEDVEEEQRRRTVFIPATSDTEPVIQFKRWTSMITSYFTDLRMVTKAAKTRPLLFGSKFIVAKRCNHDETLNWPEVIRSFFCQDTDAYSLIASSSDSVSATDDSSLQPTSSVDSTFTAKQADNAIKLLQSYIDRNRKMLAAFGSEAPSFDDSRSESNKVNKTAGTVFWTGKQHCECIAASLFRYLNDATPKGPENVRNVISVRTSFGF